MALPHPHGTDPGEIGNNSLISTGDTPGSVGGRFVGMGEEGTSAIANRSAWALSENVDYLYQKIAGDLSVPSSVLFVSTSQSSYHLSADVFCGNSSYPGVVNVSDPEGMLMLFTVLDNYYNELTDGEGHEVRVKYVKETTDVTDCYKTGFVTNPWVHFHLVDPATGVEFAASYTIPAAIQVRLVFGLKTNIESLPADAFSRHNIRAAAELDAGVFLQDGTRKMVGDANYDGHNILNLAEARSEAAADLLLHGQKDLALQGDELVKFQDQYLAAPVPLGEDGTTAITAPLAPYRPSVLGAVNSATEVNNLLIGDRSLNRTGSFVSSTTPSLDYPDLDLLVNGQTIKVLADTLAVPSAAAWYLVYFNPATGVVEVMDWNDYPSLLPVGSILLWSGNWSGSAWSSEDDVRWPSGKRGDYFTVYVGDGVGADFSDINLAASLLPYSFLPEKNHFKGEIVIVGIATLSATFNLKSGWRVRGLIGENGKAQIHTTSTFTISSPLIKFEAPNTLVVLENLDFYWDNTTSSQSAGSCAIIARGPGAVLRNLTFVDGTYKFANCILSGANTQIHNCTFAGWTESAVKSGGSTSTGIRVGQCTFTPLVSSQYCVNLATGYTVAGTPNVVEQCKFTAGARFSQVVVGSACIVRGNYSVQSNATYDPYFVEMVASFSGQYVAVDVHGNVVDYGNGIKCNFTVAAVAHLSCYQNSFRSLETAFVNLINTTCDSASRFSVCDNSVNGITSASAFILDARTCWSLTFARNRLVGVVGRGVYIANDTSFDLSDNFFEGFTIAGSASEFLWVTNVGYSGCKIRGNHFGSVGSPTCEKLLRIDSNDVVIEDNVFDCTSLTVDAAIHLLSAGNLVKGNRFSYGLKNYILLDQAFANAHRNRIIGNRFRGGITFEEYVVGKLDVTAVGILVESGAIGTIIGDNNFDSITGRAIEDWGIGTRIHENTFESVQGQNVADNGGVSTRAWQAAVFLGGSGAMVSGNMFRNTGHAVDETLVQNHCILSHDLSTVIQGNQMFGCIGSGGATVTTDKFFFIAIRGLSGEEAHVVVANNRIYHDCAVATLPALLLCGIVLGTECMFSTVSGNLVRFIGSAGNPVYNPFLCWMVDDGAKNTLSANILVGTANSVAEVALDATGSAGGGTYLGNCSEVHPMVLNSLGGNEMCVGNHVFNAGTLTAAGAPSNTIYTGNSYNPRDDFNRSI